MQRKMVDMFLLQRKWIERVKYEYRERERERLFLFAQFSIESFSIQSLLIRDGQVVDGQSGSFRATARRLTYESEMKASFLFTSR